MCRVEERIYISEAGGRQKFEDVTRCLHAPRGKLCANVKRRTTEYFPKTPRISRDEASSPASNNPPTPTGTGSYLVEQRRPSGTDRRPEIKESVIKPEIIIQFGSRKDKTKKYPQSSSRTYKRSSLTNSIGSNEVAIESPGSEASYTVRTGYPDTSLPNDSLGYTARPVVPHRHTSSSSSFTTSSQPPSLYATSDPDSPSTQRAARYPATVIHNPMPSASATRAPAPAPVSIPTSPYRTTVVTPSSSSDNMSPDGIFPLNYSSIAIRSGAPHAGSTQAAAPEITDRGAFRDRVRQLNAEAERRKRQEEADHVMAKKIAKDEEDKRQVRFELGRAEMRASERAQNKIAQSEKERAEEREEARRRKKERAAKEERDKLNEDIARRERQIKEDEAKLRKSRDSRPPISGSTKRQSRRLSISQADADERERLLAETEAQMARERAATEQREREERATELQQRQQTTEYWSPRGGDRYAMTNDGPSIGRRKSVSTRRPSLSSGSTLTSLGRPGSSRRVSIIQKAPPATLPPLSTSFSTRPTSSHGPPPVLSPNGSQQTYNTRPPSARHTSYHYDNPFAHPSTRTSTNAEDNPFAQTAYSSSPAAIRDPWDTRSPHNSLPTDGRQSHARQSSDVRQPNTIDRRGKDILAAADGRSRQHDRARQASRKIGKVVGFEDDYEDSDSDDENQGHSRSGQRKH